MNKKNNFAFTLVEIMVVIVLIMIFFLWIQTLNFWQKSDEQKAEIFANKIISLIETKRNEVLTWRWKVDWTNFKRVETIEINYDSTKKEITTKENTLDSEKIIFHEKEKIYKISCEKDEKSNFSIIFENNKIKLINGTDNCIWKLNLEAWVNWKKFKIIFDPVSWLIKKEKIL